MTCKKCSTLSEFAPELTFILFIKSHRMNFSGQSLSNMMCPYYECAYILFRPTPMVYNLTRRNFHQNSVQNIFIMQNNPITLHIQISLFVILRPARTLRYTTYKSKKAVLRKRFVKNVFLDKVRNSSSFPSHVLVKATKSSLHRYIFPFSHSLMRGTID